MAPRVALLIVSTVAALVVVGCAGDGSPDATPIGSSGSNETLTVAAEDIGFPEATFYAEAGSVGVTYRNDGRIRHTLLIEGVQGFELDVSANGDVDQGSVDLEPGRYTLYCDVPGHREAGMVATLEVD